MFRQLSNYVFIELEKNIEVLKAFHTLYPGSRLEEHPRFPLTTSTDNGGEWEAEFDEGIEIERTGGLDDGRIDVLTKLASEYMVD